MLYAVCYLVGARIIRYYRRLRRIVRLNCLHIKWAVRRFYFDLKEQRSAAAPSKGYWKREWKKAFSQTRDALHDWNKHRKQPDSGLHLDELLKAFFPSLRKLAGTVNYILPVAGMIVLISTIHHFSTLTFGLRVQYNGEHIGYILSESDFSEAEAKVKERIVNEAYLPPEDSVPIYSLEVVEEDQISDQSILINNIIRASGNEIEEAAGLYVDDEFIGAVKDGDTLLLSLKARKEGTYQPGMTEEELENCLHQQKRQALRKNLLPRKLPLPIRQNLLNLLSQNRKRLLLQKKHQLPRNLLHRPIPFRKATPLGILPISLTFLSMN